MTSEIKYGDVLKNPGCDFIVMFLYRMLTQPKIDEPFEALVLHDGDPHTSRPRRMIPEITVCGDLSMWVRMDD